ncbi:MAG TPA: hypothetical protein VF072_08735 [Thermoleophilaceae bacterium]
MRLVEYLRALPESDPRLATIAAAVDDLEEIGDLIPDDDWVPATGPEFLDYLAAKATGPDA